MKDTSELLASAAAQHQAGRLEAAESLYRGVLALDPDSSAGHHHLGVLMVETGRVHEGIAHLRLALDLAPETGYCWQSLAEALRLAGRSTEALSLIEQAISIGLDTSDARRLRDQLTQEAQTQSAPYGHLPSGDAAEPCETESAHHVREGQSTRSATDSSVESTPPPSERAKLIDLLRERRFAEAERSARQMIEHSPTDHFGRKMLLLIYGQTRQPGAALAVVDQALELDPKNVEMLNSRGNIMRALGRTEESLASYRQALDTDPLQAEPAYNLGIALQELGQLEEAVSWYRNAIAIQPGFAQAHNNLGNAMCALGRFEEALDSYQQALKYDPQLSEARNNLGLALSALGRLDEAESLLGVGIDVVG